MERIRFIYCVDEEIDGIDIMVDIHDEAITISRAVEAFKTFLQACSYHPDNVAKITYNE